MGKNYRPGSEGAAQQKSTTRFRIVFTVATVLIFALTFFDLGTHLYDFKQRASGLANGIGVVCFLGSILALWASDLFFLPQRGEWLYSVLWLGLLALGIASSCGFNFTL